ncbi:MAG TPA: phosphatase PAP2 family protein [Flavitalea sp.]|nr:phosphatase PAP2 family protein [Flavitalea sp.]
MINRFRKFIAGIALLSIELIIVFILFLLSVITIAFIINEVFRLNDTQFDASVFNSIRPYINDTNTRIMRFITFFATGEFLVPANIILAFIFLIKKHRWYSLSVPVVSLGSYLVLWSLKQYFSRVRPDDPVFKAAMGFSFPSGHAMSAMTFYGLIIYLVWKNVENVTFKWILTFLLIIFIHLIGFSRIYLRVHYASDVIGGFSLGLIWVVLSLLIMHFVERYVRKEIAPEVEAPK